ncbi:Transaldolase [Arcticibacter svalbardensis MN12-7]|uniref:Transaldolase n=1 Tax=Arcticibacter svalbardensis MN12-7 TaxID=1150600 RepID=R9GP68_9SPHI|nr:transaldolase [Arcticibacter svalbardensis]EOR93627.1 Transaldolase [Arcticibacter svalbardensis MN12-7]
MKNPLAKIPTFGQSIWLDYIRRKFIASGELKKLIDEDELRGLTSNPAIFEEAISKSDDYADTIKKLAKAGHSAEEIFLNLAIEDVQSAADLFSGVYEKTDALDGYVSLEVSPGLALVTEGTITEARSSWKTLDRKNVMIKVPGTNEGLPAIEQLISDGININVTLLFGLDRYSKVAEAYIKGLEKRVEKGEPIAHIASVASFFLSRIDTMVDPMLQEIVDKKNDKSTLAKALLGKTAIASARMAYHIFKEKFSSDRFKALEEKGAKPQRLLWASTSTKNPLYNELMYIEALIGPETVNTVPKETLNSYRKHGNPANRLESGMEEAEEALQQLEEVGIDLAAVTKKLEEEGIQKFIKPFDSLMSALNEKREEKLESK